MEFKNCLSKHTPSYLLYFKQYPAIETQAISTHNQNVRKNLPKIIFLATIAVNELNNI